jgi:hypothetical protein
MKAPSTQESSKHMDFEESSLVQDLFARARKTSSKPSALSNDNESNLRRYIKLVDSFKNSGVGHCIIMDGLAPLLETGQTLSTVVSKMALLPRRVHCIQKSADY